MDTIVSDNGLATFDADRLGILNGLDRKRQRLLLREREEVRGIWDTETSPFTRYRVELRCVGALMGGIPKNPAVMEGWLRTKSGFVMDEEETALALKEILARQGVPFPELATIEELVAASKEAGAETKGNGFYSDRHGLVLESRCVKAMLKENANIAFAGEKWGARTKVNAKGAEVEAYRGKGARSLLAESVFVDVRDDAIPLGVGEPDFSHLQVGHVVGSQGPRATLTYYDAVWQPTLAFTVLSFNDVVKPDQWKVLLLLGQENGLGALRSQGFGRFKVTGFDRL